MRLSLVLKSGAKSEPIVEDWQQETIDKFTDHFQEGLYH